MPAEKEFKMMPGTQSGPSYMAFARNGGMALGVKFIAIKEGAALGVADTTWIGARLRSAPEDGLFDDEKGKVVKLQKPAELAGRRLARGDLAEGRRVNAPRR